ncbi:MAG: hypothetical protein AMXMBFR84_39610 [Candidatus Hydrogenedentota bacterium]
MALASCPRCQKLFEKKSARVCPKCVPEEDEDYEKVRAALAATPNQSAEEVAKETQVSLDCVLRLLEDGRIVTTLASKQIKCGRCGAPAISLSKKLCERCLNELNAKLAIEQSKIRLPKKKDVEVGTALNTFTRAVDDDNKTGGTKYNR